MIRRKIITLLADSRNIDPLQVSVEHGARIFEALQLVVRDVEIVRDRARGIA